MDTSPSTGTRILLSIHGHNDCDVYGKECRFYTRDINIVHVSGCIAKTFFHILLRANIVVIFSLTCAIHGCPCHRGLLIRSVLNREVFCTIITWGEWSLIAHRSLCIKQTKIELPILLIHEVREAWGAPAYHVIVMWLSCDLCACTCFSKSFLYLVALSFHWGKAEPWRNMK